MHLGLGLTVAIQCVGVGVNGVDTVALGTVKACFDITILSTLFSLSRRGTMAASSVKSRADITVEIALNSVK